MKEYSTIAIGQSRPLLLKPLIKGEKNELLNKKFNRLTILEFLGSNKKGQVFCKCRCDCGCIIPVNVAHLKNGNTKSCGCYKREITVERNKKDAHPHRKTRLYRIWKRMHQRCYEMQCDDYKDYGAKGVVICNEWHEYYNFHNWAISHGYADNLTIDRIEVTGIYQPSNCRWATILEQARNKRNNHFITFRGHTKTLSEWCYIFRIESSKVRYRLSHNWPLEKAFIN
jgi:hypothetical protein